MIFENAGYGLAGLSAFLLLGRMLAIEGLRETAVKIIAVFTVVLLAMLAFKLIGDQKGHLLGWLAAIGILFFGLVLVGVA